MGMPVDDGVSAFYWNEGGLLCERATLAPKLDDNGQPIVWTEPLSDPNESLPYEGPALWAVSAYRLDLPPETAVVLWIEAETEGEARTLFAETAGFGMGLISIAAWEPENLAQHLRWIAGHEGKLAAIINRQ